MLVSRRDTSAVNRYDAETGDFMGLFASGGGLPQPNSLAFMPAAAVED